MANSGNARTDDAGKPRTATNEDQPIHKAALAGNLADLIVLLDEDRQLRAKGWFNRTPLHCAAQAGAAACVGALLARGAPADSRDSVHKRSPLFEAVASDSPECVRLLLSHGADPNARDSHRGDTPLFEARSSAVLCLLTEYGADLNVISHSRQYPFEYCAAYLKSPDALAFWLRRGVAVNHVPGFAWPALHGALRLNEPKDAAKGPVVQCLQLLLEHDADPNLRDKQGEMPLHVAIKSWDEDICRMLLDGGADPNVQDWEGRTPLHLAIALKKEPLVRLLVSRGADVNLRDGLRRSPYDLATLSFAATLPILAPHWRDVPETLPTIKELTDRLAATRSVQEHGGLCPCSGRELDLLESKFRVCLPARYKEFLLLAGRGAGRFLIGDYLDAFYEGLLEFGQNPKYMDPEEYGFDLPDDYFVFCHNTCDTGLLLFLTEGATADPPVYYVGETRDGDQQTPLKVDDTFTAWLEAQVVQFEVYDKQDIARERAASGSPSGPAAR